jgi:hypothetical protein
MASDGYSDMHKVKFGREYVLSQIGLGQWQKFGREGARLAR